MGNGVQNCAGAALRRGAQTAQEWLVLLLIMPAKALVSCWQQFLHGHGHLDDLLLIQGMSRTSPWI